MAKHVDIRWAVALAMLAVLIACGSSGGGGGSSAPSSLGGSWSCNLTEVWDGVEQDPGEVVQTSVAGPSLWVSAVEPHDLTRWFCEPLTVSGTTASPGAPFTCQTGSASDPTITISGGDVAVSADGNTLTVDETGKNAAGNLVQITGTCARTGPPSSSSSGGSSGSSSGGTPTCHTNSDCAGCARCSAGACYACPVGAEGICTC
jgi:hypothetical protein